ncbi:MAG TPA: hypothetical protein VGZ50_08750, partial [Actinomycetota bacterium]|nr:hypothetical protein [Actinomycetota bacterium]
MWTELSCEIHEITTQTGRASAPDRFVPGTASIIASNVHGISDMIFPEFDPTEGMVSIPQPPIEQEETLDAPTATTIISDGWSFTDDFERAPPKWIFPAAWAGGVPPYGTFKIIDGAMEPELYYDSVVQGYVGNGAAQWTVDYDPNDMSYLTLALTNLDWPVAPTAGTPEIVIELYLRMGTTTKECQCARLRFRPIFGGANEVLLEIFHMGPNGEKIAGTGPTTFTAGTGTNGIFGARTVTIATNIAPAGQQISATLSDVFDVSWDSDVDLAGARVGFAMQYVEGRVTGLRRGPRATYIEGVNLTDDVSRPLGSGWVLPSRWSASYDGLITVDGAMMPAEELLDRYGGEYHGYGMSQWVSDFIGDQHIEIEVTNVSRPHQIVNGQSYIEFYTHGSPDTFGCMVARINYQPAWGTGDNQIFYELYQQANNGSYINYAPAAQGTIHLGPTNGVFPEPAYWRLESDTLGEQRLYYNSALVLTAQAPNQATGSRIGIHLDSYGAMPGWLTSSPPSVKRPSLMRVTKLSAGLREPLGTEELGMWVRIGVNHETLGDCWFFRGFVDGLEPTYVPD